MSSHLATLLTKAGTPLFIVSRPTPAPGPHEVLIAISSIALNPVDHYQRDYGIMLTSFPAVLGSDISGTIHSVGTSVTSLNPGTRVLAFATAFYAGGAPDYGGFQKMVLVPAANVCPIPEGLSWNDAAVMPMAAATTWAGLATIGIARTTKYTPEDKKGILVWGGASSIGSGAIQIVAALGFVVYTTASVQHHDYMKTLGASRVFDYKSLTVVEDIVAATKEDGLEMSTCYDAVPNALDSCIQILQQTKKAGVEAEIAHAPRIPDGFNAPEGVEVKFVQPPGGEEARSEHFSFVFGTWLKDALVKGSFVASPKIRVCPGGLEGLDGALDMLRGGVSGEKLVLEV